MSIKEKNEIIAVVTELLERMIPVEEITPESITVTKTDKPEMLTIKECAALVSSLTEHTVRMLVKHGKVKYIRCGQGARGKILESKYSLPKYLGAVSAKKSGASPNRMRAKLAQRGCRGNGLPQRLLSLHQGVTKVSLR